MAQREAKRVEGTWAKVFCPNARCLTEAEVMDLPEDKKQAAVKSGERGVWLEVFCSGEACPVEGERVDLPRLKEASEKGKRGLWLNLFCPEDRCVVEKGAGIP